MNPVRDDILTPLRLYARGYLAGVAASSLSVSTTLESEARCLVALEHLGIDAATRWSIMDYARMEAEVELGVGTDPYTVRHYAAQVVIAWLRLILKRAKQKTLRAA